MIRVVLDTNVLVSASLQPLGPSAHLLLLALNGSLRLCMTGSIYAEYEEVISRPRFQRSPDVIASTLQAIHEAGVWVQPDQPVNACSDPDDDIFFGVRSGVACGVSCNRKSQAFSAFLDWNPDRIAAVAPRPPFVRHAAGKEMIAGPTGDH